MRTNEKVCEIPILDVAEVSEKLLQTSPRQWRGKSGIFKFNYESDSQSVLKIARAVADEIKLVGEARFGEEAISGFGRFLDKLPPRWQQANNFKTQFILKGFANIVASIKEQKNGKRNHNYQTGQAYDAEAVKLREYFERGVGEVNEFGF